MAVGHGQEDGCRLVVAKLESGNEICISIFSNIWDDYKQINISCVSKTSNVLHFSNEVK